MLSKIFYPSSVAVVGASRTRGKIGNEILRNLIYSGYRGGIYPVNPNAEAILGLKAYPTVKEIPYSVDLAIIAVPAKIVPSIMKDCVEKGVKGAVIISSGFSEVSNRELEDEVKRIASGKVRIIGPNTIGIINTANNLNASFAPNMPLKGNIAFITQSGALGGALIDWTIREKIGLSKIISVGNKCDVGDEELLEFLAKDKETKVIAMYIEAIKDGRRFMEVAKKVSKLKPIVVVKAGRTEAGKRAASSHTGALAGSFEIYKAAFKQCGVIYANDTEELFDKAIALAEQSPAKGKRVAIVTNGGGAGIMAADACEELGLLVPELSEKTQSKLKEFLPEIASTRNPIDIAGDAGYERYKATIDVVLKNNEVDAVIVIFVHTALTEPVEPARALVECLQRAKKPVVGCWIGGYEVEEAIRILKEENVPNFPTPKRAVKALSALIRQGEVLYDID